MSISFSTLSTIIDQRRRSTSGAIDQTKKIQIINDVLQDMQARADYSFTQRTHRFEYLPDEPDYNIEAVLGLTDFKNIKDLRTDWDPTQDFTYLAPNEFDLVAGKLGSNLVAPNRWVYTVEYNDGVPILRVNYPTTSTQTLLHAGDDHDSNGTWVVDSSNSDATNITTDATVGRVFGTSISFDTDVSQSNNNYADIYVPDMDAIDLTDHLDVGKIRMWVWIPDVTYITGFTGYWGSDTSSTPTTKSNYWSKAVTATADNGTFVSGWNQVEFDWEGATKTGSPNVASVVYFQLRISYSASQTDDTDFRINNIESIIPILMEVKYYSNHVAQTSAGVWQAELTAATDSTLVPTRYREVLVNGVMARVFALQGSPHTEESREYEGRYERGLRELISQVGYVLPKEVRKLKANINWDYD